MDKFFKFVQRFNSLLPLLAIIFLLLGICWAFLQEHRPRVTFWEAPNVPGQSQQFHVLNQGQYIEKNGIWIFHLTVSDSDSWSYEGSRGKTQNLLLSPDTQMAGHWLFKDQGQLIRHVETFPNHDRDLVKCIYTEATPVAKDGSNESLQKSFTIYLAKLNGEKPVTILSNVDKVIARNLQGNVLQIIYQQGLSVKKIKISIDDFTIRSNQDVATLAGTAAKITKTASY